MLLCVRAFVHVQNMCMSCEMHVSTLQEHFLLKGSLKMLNEKAVPERI